MAFDFTIQVGAVKIATAAFIGRIPQGDPLWVARPADAVHLKPLPGTLDCEVTAGVVPKTFTLTATVPGDPDQVPTAIATIRGDVVGAVAHGTIEVKDAPPPAEDDAPRSHL